MRDLSDLFKKLAIKQIFTLKIEATTICLQEYYLPYEQQHVGYEEGHFYENQQSHSRDLGKVAYDKKKEEEKEEAQYVFDEYQPTTHYEDAGQSTPEYQGNNYEIQSKQPHQDTTKFEESQSHYIDAEDQLHGEEYQFEDFESKDNLSTEDAYNAEDPVQFNDNLGFLPPYTAAAQPRSFTTFSRYPEKSTSVENFSARRRNWPPPGLNQYSVSQGFAGWTRKR